MPTRGDKNKEINEWRAGQTAINMLALLRPDLAEKIYHGELDVFYDSTNLPSLWLWLIETIEKEILDGQAEVG